MTTLGKVLAVLNLVLALFVGWFVMATYVAGGNWHDAYVKADQQLKAVRPEFDAYEKELRDTRTQTGEVKAQLDAVQKALDQEKKDRTQDVAAWRDKYAKQGAAYTQLQADMTRSTAEIKRRDDELALFKGELAKRDTQLRDMEKRVEDMRAEATEARIAQRAEHDRNERLLQQNERLTKRVEQLEQQLRGGAAVAGGTPPPEDVEGVVKATDPQSGYVTLSIGSDAGLSRGNTLQVYRLRPEPAYLGTVEVLAVRANEAVAKPITRARGQIQVGDQVASRITSGRR